MSYRNPPAASQLRPAAARFLATPRARPDERSEIIEHIDGGIAQPLVILEMPANKDQLWIPGCARSRPRRSPWRGSRSRRGRRWACASATCRVELAAERLIDFAAALDRVLSADRSLAEHDGVERRAVVLLFQRPLAQHAIRLHVRPERSILSNALNFCRSAIAALVRSP
jgi:hypothetical protein